MMKQPPFATKRRLSKFCRWILVLSALKLCVLGTIFIDFTGTGDTPVNGSLTVGSANAAEVTPPAPQIRSGGQSPFAQQPAPAPEPQTPDLASRPDQPVVPAAPAPAVSPFVPRDSAQRKQEELNRREQELLALQQQMQTRLEELRKLETRIQSMLKTADKVQDDKLNHLIDVYTNMKAKQAAEVLATLDENIAVRILAGMRGKQAGEILSYMQAAPAAKLSELLSKTQLP